MTDYSVNIQDQRYRVKINRDDTWLNNHPAQQKLIPLNHNGLHLMRHGNSVMELHLESRTGDSYEVLYQGKRVIVNIDDGSQRPQHRNAQDTSKSLKAPMPGLVIDVPVKTGDSVQKGDILVILESMKMQMQLKAEVSGIISEIKVEAGSQVEKGCAMVRIE